MRSSLTADHTPNAVGGFRTTRGPGLAPDAVRRGQPGVLL